MTSRYGFLERTGAEGDQHSVCEGRPSAPRTGLEDESEDPSDDASAGPPGQLSYCGAVGVY